jgi:threonylcarbamoyladenosine tRNA methylthiotransferase MtaB
MPDKVTPDVKDRRAARVRRLSAMKLGRFHDRFAGRVLDVLFEHREGEYWTGYTANYIRVAARSDAILENELARVRLERSRGDVMAGRIEQLEYVEVAS